MIPAAPDPSTAPPVPQPPPVPTLPFAYRGILEDSDGDWTVQLSYNNQFVVASKGDLIDSLYRLDGIEGHKLIFTYLPRSQTQILALPSDNE